ncbi:hypothetical protein GCM10027062_17940 [Nocardioides hungaricus]
MLRISVALTEEHQTRHGQTVPREKFAEVGVGRHEDSLLLPCGCQHIFVDMAYEAAIRDVDNIMSGFGDEWCQPVADALVQQELTPSYGAEPDAR